MDAVAALAARLSVGLGSPGVCHPCLGLVAHEGRGAEPWVVPTLWAEGWASP